MSEIEASMVVDAVRICRERDRACTIKSLGDELDVPKWKAQRLVDAAIEDGLLAKTSVPGSIHLIGE